MTVCHNQSNCRHGPVYCESSGHCAVQHSTEAFAFPANPCNHQSLWDVFSTTTQQLTFNTRRGLSSMCHYHLRHESSTLIVVQHTAINDGLSTTTTIMASVESNRPIVERSVTQQCSSGAVYNLGIVVTCVIWALWLHLQTTNWA